VPNPGTCGKRWPPDGHFCEHEAGHEGHHDVVEWAGPWLRWCDDPEHCERPDCDLSAYNVRRDARIAASTEDLKRKGHL